MARSGGGTTTRIIAASQAVEANWSMSFRAKFNGAPSGAGLQFCVNFGNTVTDFDAGYLHDHTAAGFRDAFYWKNTAGSYYAAQISPGTGSWVVITCTYDGSNIRCYLGTASAVTTAISGSQGAGPYSLCLFNNSNGVTSQSLSGDMAFFAKWAVTLTDADAASLGAGYHPSCVRPESLTHIQNVMGNLSPEPDPVSGATWSISGTLAKVDNPRIIMPRRRVSLSMAAAAATTTPNLIGGNLIRPNLVRGRLAA